MARNTSSLLIHESHVARVTDPAGGSYAVEQVTDDLARRGWEELQRLEADGGADAALDQPGGLYDRIKDEAMQPRRRQVATRRRAITGVSEFPNLHEELPERRPVEEGFGPNRFTASCGVMPASIGVGAAGSSQLTTSKATRSRRNGS